MKKDQQKSDDISLKIKNPKWTAKMGLVFGVLLIFLNPLFFLLFKTLSRGPYGLVPIILGTIGIYYGIKQKAGWKIIFLNVLAIILGIISLVVTGLLLMMLRL